MVEMDSLVEKNKFNTKNAFRVLEGPLCVFRDGAKIKVMRFTSSPPTSEPTFSLKVASIL